MGILQKSIQAAIVCLLVIALLPFDPSPANAAPAPATASAGAQIHTTRDARPRTAPEGLTEDQKIQWQELIDLEWRYYALVDAGYDWQGSDPGEQIELTFAAFADLAELQTSLEDLRQALEDAEAAFAAAKIAHVGLDGNGGTTAAYDLAVNNEAQAKDLLEELETVTLPANITDVQNKQQDFDADPSTANGQALIEAMDNLNLTNNKIQALKGELYAPALDLISIPGLERATAAAKQSKDQTQAELTTTESQVQTAQADLDDAIAKIDEKSQIVDTNLSKFSNAIYTAETKNKLVKPIYNNDSKDTPKNADVISTAGPGVITAPAAGNSNTASDVANPAATDQARLPAVNTLDIFDPGIPLMGGLEGVLSPLPMLRFNADRWALADVFLAVLSLALTVMLTVGLIAGNRAINPKNNDSEPRTNDNRNFLSVSGIVFGLLVLAVVFQTQNLASPMALIDAWTPFLTILVFVQAALTVSVLISSKAPAEPRHFIRRY